MTPSVIVRSKTKPFLAILLLAIFQTIAVTGVQLVK